MCEPDIGPSVEAWDVTEQPKAESRQAMTLEDTSRLREALDAIPELRQANTWRKVLNQLRVAHADLAPDKFAPDYDTFDILEASITAERGLRDLAVAIRIVLGRTDPGMAFTDLVSSLQTSGLTPEQRSQVRAILVSAPPAAHAVAASHPDLAGFAHLFDESCDPAQAFERFDQAPDEGRTLGQLCYLEVVGHQLDKDPSILIHQTVNRVLLHDPTLRHVVEDLCDSLGAATETSDNSTGTAQSADGDSQMITVTVQGSELKQYGQAPTVTVWGGVPPRNTNFAGRDELLEQIRASLRQDASAALVPQAVHGYGGVGKTQIAVEFAYRFQDDYDLVWWVTADEERSIRRSLVSLARRLGLAESVDADDTVGSVLDVLRRGESHARWLLIFDNAGPPDSIQNYRPRAGRGHVIVTSRSNRWLGQEATVSVDVFTEEESVAMLRRRWADLNDAEALRLATRLGHLPLALEQAAAVHNESGMTLDEYLRALTETPTQVLEEGRPTGYSSSVAQTFQIAYRELTAKSRAAAQLFGICALMSSQPISVAMLIRGRGAPLPSPLTEELRTEMTRRNAIRDMGGHALALLDPGRNLIRIHHLVRDLLREELDDDERVMFTKAAHSILALANPGEPDAPENWPSLAQLTPHVIPSEILHSDDAEVRTVFLDQIRYLYAIGDYLASRALGELAVKAWTAKLGPDDVMTMVANRHLANSLREQGEYSRVRSINLDTWQRMVRVLGPQHEHTLATANSVGADLRLQGEFEKAREYDEQNYAAYLETLGREDLATQRAANNLAVDLRLLGKFERAREMDEANIRRLSDMFGDDDIRTFSSYTSLARDLYGLGRYEQALTLQMQKLRIHERTLNEGHMEMLRARRNLAILLRKNGHHGKALEAAEAAHSMYRTKFGEAHDQTFAATLTLANALRVAGRLDEALEHGQSAMDAYRINLGAEHPITMAAMVDVAIILQLQDRPADALVMNEEALRVLTTSLGPDHPWRLCALANQASLLASLGRPDEALDLSQQAYTRSERVRGEEHPYTLAAAANLSMDLETKGEHIEASARRRSAISLLRKVLGDRHPEVINVGLATRTDADIEPPSI